MRGVFLILKKEFMELLRDRKTLFFTLFVPLLIYPLMFSMMNKLGESDSAKRRSKASRVALVDPERLVAPLLEADRQKFELVAKPEGDAKAALRDQKLDLVVEVEAGAAAKATRQETYTITALRDESERSSELALKRMKEVLQTQDKAMVSARLKSLNASTQLAEPTKLVTEDAGDAARSAGKAFGAFLPYLVMMMMLMGSMNQGIYATAGEKERGTLLSLLATSMPRSQIIGGKLLYIFCMGVLSALINLLSMGFSITRLVAHEASAQAAAQGAAAAGSGSVNPLGDPTTLLLAFLLMVPLGLLFSNVILFLGIQAKNSQQAGTSIMPFMFIVIFLGVFTMAPGVDKMPILPYLPVVNVSLAIRKLFGQQGNTLEYLVALGMTLGLAGAMTWLSTTFLKREEAIFRA